MIIHGDCLEKLKDLEDNSVDAVVTDPPYGLAFMGKRWDYDVPTVDVWRECLRVLKPGGHMLVACGTRTQHRMVVNIEDAGFEIRDVITWLYGSGFPKSLNISKMIDKEAGAKREVISTMPAGTGPLKNGHVGSSGGGLSIGTERSPELKITKPNTKLAKQWDGWGTALKPACEFWTLCRKPISESTVAKNVVKWGTGAINIDGCRIESTNLNQGRWPANLILDEESARMLDQQTTGGRSIKASVSGRNTKSSKFSDGSGEQYNRYSDFGSTSRFFYCAKVSPSERGKDNNHPTLKPIKLMQYLVTLITPPGGLVLDPFMGSGSTGIACKNLGFKFIGIEREAEYVAIAERRLA